MSIATETGDSGETSLVGGSRVSKADARVEAYGTVDELGSFLGLARSLCSDPRIAAWTEQIQRNLFRVGAALSTPAESGARPSHVSQEDVDALTKLVHEAEATPGLLADWALPGSHTAAAAFDVARTVCRRAERRAVQLDEAGGEVSPQVVAYLNRLSDLLWLFGRMLELAAGGQSKLRDASDTGPKWSRAW